VYAICKNEARFAESWMQSNYEADKTVVLDTGSTDGTPDILSKLGAKVTVQTFKPWRFDIARNRSMELIPEDTDICVCTDLDERLEEGWREKMEILWTEETTKARLTYIFSHNSDGTPNTVFPREHIHKYGLYKWSRPVHEYPKYIGKDKEIITDMSSIVLHHYPDITKSRSQYTDLLEIAAEEDPLDSSVLLWLGREYMFSAKYRKAIDTFIKYLALPALIWAEEKSAAMRFTALCMNRLGERDSAKAWLNKASEECPYIREPYIELARIFYGEKDWKSLYDTCAAALKITKNTGSYLIMPECWSYAFYDYMALACYNLGMLDQAALYAELAYRLEPDNERLKNNLEFFRK
jgi:glycosyltransferase involved in cell wall biosynthesis